MSFTLQQNYIHAVINLLIKYKCNCLLYIAPAILDIYPNLLDYLTYITSMQNERYTGYYNRDFKYYFKEYNISMLGKT